LIQIISESVFLFYKAPVEVHAKGMIMIRRALCLGAVGSLLAATISGCASRQEMAREVRQETSMELCVMLSTSRDYKDTRRAELARRDEDCSIYQEAIAAEIERKAKVDALTMELIRSDPKKPGWGTLL
jgi:hypothetical protein